MAVHIAQQKEYEGGHPRYRFAVAGSGILLSTSFLLCFGFFLQSLTQLIPICSTLTTLEDGQVIEICFHLPLALLVLSLVAAVPLTHTITGKKRHQTHWRFFQPWQGGRQFVILQGASWILFAFTVVIACYWFYHVAQRLVLSAEVVASASSASFTAVLSQCLMVASIFAFDPHDKNKNLKNADLEGHFRLVFKRFRSFVICAVLVNLQIFFALFVIIPFIVMSADKAAAIIAIIFSIYLPTYFGQPATTGRRRWDTFRYSFVIEDLIKWNNGKVIFNEQLKEKTQYIFAFAPHGVMPLSATWLLQHPEWIRNTPKIDTVLLGASIFHYIPFLRDAAMWIGSREVTQKSFQYSLNEGKSVLVVPGGVSEIRYSKSSDPNVRLLTRHKGFIRMAMKNGTPLVPVYSFGETRYFDTLEIPFITNFCYRFCKTPFPYFVGIAGLQVPRPIDVTVIVGKPIPVEKNPHPTDEEVSALHAKFYSSLTELHDRYRSEAGYPNQQLLLMGMDKHSSHKHADDRHFHHH